MDETLDTLLENATMPLEAEGSPDGLRFLDKYTLFPNDYLTDLSSKYTKAYAAKGDSTTQNEVYALRCDHNLTQRREVMEILQSFTNLSLVTPLDWGPLYWPSDNRSYFTIIATRPSGQPLTHIDRSIWRSMSYGQICTRFIEPLGSILSEFEKNGITHRSIRPQNIYYEAETHSIYLGECFSTPPAMEQPALFESLSAMPCHSMAKGDGTNADDLYSLGAVLGFLFGAQELDVLLSDRDLLQLKTEETSYHVILQKGAPPKHLETVLSGLLFDEVIERWRPHDLLTHISGEHAKHARPRPPERPPRPFPIEDKKHFFPRSVALHLSKVGKDSEKIIRSSDFNSWVRTCHTKGLIQEIEYLLSVGRVNSEPWFRTAGKILCKLTPDGPLYYKDFAFMPDGLGHALVSLRHDPEMQKLIMETISSNLSGYWQTLHDDLDPAFDSTVNRIKNSATLALKKAPGFGIERTLYETSEFLHCLSPLLEQNYITSPHDLLVRLDTLCADKENESIQLIDRHILAYLLAHQPSIPLRTVRGLEESYSDTENALSLLMILNATQKTFKVPALPHLCTALIKTMPTLVERYKLKKRREAVSALLYKIISEGIFEKILDVVDNKVELALDEEQLSDSKISYKRLSISIVGYEKLLSNADEMGQLLGEQAAAIASGFLAAISLSLFYLL